MATLAINKRARFDYEILETMEAGISLLGTEVKSAKAGNMQLRGAFVTIYQGTPMLTNATIPPWQAKNTAEDYDPERSRKLLLKKAEIDRIIGAKSNEGLTVVPLSVYTKGSLIKIEIGLARGKKKHSKKQAKKERDILRDTERMLRGKE